MSTATSLRTRTGAPIRPLRFKVVVKMDPAEKKIGSILVPTTMQDKRAFEITRGEVVEIAPAAFGDREQWPTGGPKVGDRVFINKYAGAQLTTDENTQAAVVWRVIEDQDVVGLINE